MDHSKELYELMLLTYNSSLKHTKLSIKMKLESPSIMDSSCNCLNLTDIDKLVQKATNIEHKLQYLKENSDKLAKYGGFDLFESWIEGVQNMNPERKARKRIFLTDQSKKNDRETLKKVLEIWSSVLSESDNISDMVEISEEKSKLADGSLKKNLHIVNYCLG